MNITISVHGRWHAFELASILLQKGHSVNLFTTYPVKLAQRLVGQKISITSKPTLELRRRLYDRWHLGVKPDLRIAQQFGKFAAKNISKNTEIFVGWSSASVEAIPVVKDFGGKVIIERGSTHIVYQCDLLKEAHRELGIPYEQTSTGIKDRELYEYNEADFISVPTELAAQTFVNRGIGKEKMIVNPYGVDLSEFKPRELGEDNKQIRIVFIGGVSVRKGAPWLIRAAETLGENISCYFFGPLEKEIKTYFSKGLPTNIMFCGARPKHLIIDLLKEADIFCLPSIEEGFPLSLLQAMASGLPCLVTEAASGGIVNDFQNGLVVPEMNVAALRDSLKLLIENKELRRSLGEAARRSVESDYSWADYGARAEKVYESLIGVG